METISLIIFLLILVWIPMWYLVLSPLARSTKELAILNKIWGGWNDKKYSNEQVEELLKMREWKYHEEKVELLKTILTHLNK